MLSIGVKNTRIYFISSWYGLRFLSQKERMLFIWICLLTSSCVHIYSFVPVTSLLIASLIHSSVFYVDFFFLQNAEFLYNTQVMEFLKPLLVDTVPQVQQFASLALARLANFSEDLAEAIVSQGIHLQAVQSLK